MRDQLSTMEIDALLGLSQQLSEKNHAYRAGNVPPDLSLAVETYEQRGIPVRDEPGISLRADAVRDEPGISLRADCVPVNPTLSLVNLRAGGIDVEPIISGLSLK